MLYGHHFYDYLKCKHRVYLDLYGNPKEKDKETEFVEMLWQRGVKHEKKIVQKIAKRKKVVEVKTQDLKKGFEETLKLMKQGVDFIYQGVLLLDADLHRQQARIGADETRINADTQRRLTQIKTRINADISVNQRPVKRDQRESASASMASAGRPDLLEKTKGKSIFGSYFYLPIDIKSGHGLHHRKSGDEVKKEYAFQVMHYLDLLEKIQGFKPKQGKIINIDGQVLYFDYNDYFERYIKIKKDLFKIINKEKSYEPVIGGHCKVCHWRTHCLKWAEKNHDLSLIFGLGEKKYLLRANGVKTIKNLANLDISKFLVQAEDLRGIGLKSLQSWQRRAKIQLKGKEVIYRRITFPKVRYEIFYDLEDDPTQDVVYLYGIIERDTKNNQEKYLKFLAERPEEEASTLMNFLDYIDSFQDFVIYHYHHRERVMLEHLLKKYHLSKRLYLKFCNHSRDLYQDIIKNTDWPIYSYSLKNIANYLGFEWSVDDPSGANSIAWYNKYLKDPIKNKKYLDKIIQYNQEDCRATVLIKDYLSQENNQKL